MVHLQKALLMMMAAQIDSKWETERTGVLENLLQRPNVVVGLGNEIAGDDGVGIWVARKLRDILQDRPEIDVVPLPWAGFSLLDVLVGRKRAAIIDCLCTGLYPPGTVVRLNEKNYCGSVRLNSFHDINFVTVLELGRRMGWTMPEHIAIWGVEGAEMKEFTEMLSPPVQAASEQVIREVERWITG
jgi:hydrogenase maturation protease